MKAIITDLDRTLLRTDKSISEYTLEILKQCQANGIRIMAASARPLRAIQAYHEAIGFDAITATNGAIVSLPNRILEFGITQKSGEQILSSLLQYPDVFLSVETDQGLYSNREIPEWQPTVYDRFPILPEDALLYKILASSQQEPLYEGIVGTLTDDVYHTVSDGFLIQIMSRQASKWSGIQHMLSYYNIAPRDAVCFGDDNDDILPIQNCGIGVAMSNAIPSVLAVADHIADSNDQDGVAKYIEKTILSRLS